MTTYRLRFASVDILRGLVMVIMALDHVRNYFSATATSPENLDDPGIALFMTRWITHFCAPVFVFLCGTSAWLYARNGDRTTAELQRFLVTRGIWMIAVEILIVNALWPLWIDGYILLQVIWAIGWSMLALALVVSLNRTAILGIGLAIIAGHNLLDTITSTDLGALSPLWLFIHEEGVVPLGNGLNLYMAYPVLPWIGTMFVGYWFGSCMTDGSNWQTLARRTGTAAILLFIGLRLHGLYGDPSIFTPNGDAAKSLVEFLNVSKYPPSLQYLLMTLGPALLLMPLLERWRGKVAGWLKIFGSVPFFYYITHFALIYALAVSWSYYRFGEAFWWFRGEQAFPAGYSFSLVPTYIVWATVVFALYLPCRWYANVKRTRRDLWWLSYL